jgi:hypothetical protein
LFLVQVFVSVLATVATVLVRILSPRIGIQGLSLVPVLTACRRSILKAEMACDMYAVPIIAVAVTVIVPIIAIVVPVVIVVAPILSES